MSKRAEQQRRGKWLAACGYRPISNRYRMVSRLDRPDWRGALALYHKPYHPFDGMIWVTCLGDLDAADFYRRCVSNDKIEGLSEEAYRAAKKAAKGCPRGGLAEYLPMRPEPPRALDLGD